MYLVCIYNVFTMYLQCISMYLRKIKRMYLYVFGKKKVAKIKNMKIHANTLQIHENTCKYIET